MQGSDLFLAFFEFLGAFLEFGESGLSLGDSGFPLLIYEDLRGFLLLNQDFNEIGKLRSHVFGSLLEGNLRMKEIEQVLVMI